MSHTGQNLYELLRSLLEEWNLLTAGKNIFFVTDNGRNIVKAIEIGECEDNWQRISCFAHTLQLCIGDAKKSCKNFKILVKKCRSIVGYFARYSVARAKLKRIQKLLNPNSRPLLLIQDVDTRWNSEFAMFERLLKLRRPLSKLLKTKGM